MRRFPLFLTVWYPPLLGAVYTIGKLYCRLFPNSFKGKLSRILTQNPSVFFDQLRRSMAHTPTKRIHFHCASTGEFFQLEGAADRFLTAGYACILTFSSPSLLDWLQKNNEHRFVFFGLMPPDFSRHTRRFYSIARPACTVIAKDIWPNMLRSAFERNIPLYAVSVVIQTGELRSRLASFRIRLLYSVFTSVFTLSPVHCQRLQTLTPNIRCIPAGEARFDSIWQKKDVLPAKPILRNPGERIIIIGSSHNSDLAVIMPLLAKLVSENNGIRLIIAPHEPIQKAIDDILSYLPKNLPGIAFWNSWAPNDPFQVLIIDTIGVLSKLYRFADVAYIGGGFSTGIHNTIEAIVQDVPCIIGPKHHKFPEVSDIIAEGFCTEIQDRISFEQALLSFINLSGNEAGRKKPSQYVSSRLGAGKKIFETVLSHIST